MPITTTPSGSPQGEFSTYTPIYSTTLSSTASSVVFSNIPQTYNDLVVVVNASTTIDGRDFRMQFNSDTSTSYSLTQLGAYNSVTSSRSSNASFIQIGNFIGTSSTLPATTITRVLNYSKSTIYKTSLTRHNQFQTNVSSGYMETIAQVNLWRKAEPITSITFSLSNSTYSSGSMFTLYGIKGAVTAPKATGGDVISNDGVYWYHAFTRTGVFTPLTSLSCDYIVVAGGGSGGYGRGGGGGAGGLRSATGVTISTATTATIGAGGTNTSSSATNGSDSSFSSTTSAGGGFGAGLTPGYYGANGGSGGGASGFNTGSNSTYGSGNTPTTSPSQGNNGGSGYYDAATYGRLGGGGGGAGAVGSNASSSTPGNGGAGSNTFASWGVLTGTGFNGYFAGGGGGGRGNIAAGIGTGGAGGAGQGGADTYYPSTSGVANTGSGGGGGGGIGGFGGSGVVIVRYTI